MHRVAAQALDLRHSNPVEVHFAATRRHQAQRERAVRAAPLVVDEPVGGERRADHVGRSRLARQGRADLRRQDILLPRAA